MVTVEDVRRLAETLPRSYEVFVYGRIKFRVGQIVYVAFSRDQTLMEFGFPKEMREALINTEPDTFLLPRPSDMRYNWVVARMEMLDEEEMRDLVIDAWCMVVPQRVAREYLDQHANAGE